MYILLAIFLIFALLFVSNLAVALAAAGFWRVLTPFAKNWSAQQRAQILFALRFFPFAGAAIFVFAFLLPAYILFEPHTSGEVIGFKLAALASVSSLGMTLAFYRVFATWWRTRGLVRSWAASAEPIRVASVTIPVYTIRHPFPVIAVVGTFRPRMFIASQIFDYLTEEEFRAAIAHECGHLAARDNLKRTILRVCTDLLVVPFGNFLDRACAETAESAADEYAAQTGGSRTALNLAAALVKIARIAPPDAKPAMPAAAFLLAEQTVDVTWRVNRLLRLAEIKLLPVERGLLKTSFWLYPIFLLIVLLLAKDYAFLQKTHDFLEGIVHILQ